MVEVVSLYLMHLNFTFLPRIQWVFNDYIFAYL